MHVNSLSAVRGDRRSIDITFESNQTPSGQRSERVVGEGALGCNRPAVVFFMSFCRIVSLTVAFAHLAPELELLVSTLDVLRLRDSLVPSGSYCDLCVPADCTIGSQVPSL